MGMSDIILARSRIEKLDRCPRQWYHSYVDGLSSPGSSKDLLIGIDVHTGLELLLRSEGDLETALAGIPPLIGQDNEEHRALARALVIGWYRARWQAFTEQYEVLQIEKEILMPIAPGMKLLARLDVAVRDKESHYIYGVNWKTTSRRDGWLRKWKRDIQMMTEAVALEQDLGVPVAGMLVEGLYKGVWRDQHWATPLLFGSRKAMPDGRYKYSENRVSGWERFATWAEPFPSAPSADPQAAWIGFLPLDLVEDFFLTSTPILRNDRVVEEWLNGVVKREADARNIIAEASREDALVYFRQHFSSFNCEGCPFSMVCDGLASIGDMAKAGLLVPRESPVDLYEGGGE